jgi:transcriptional regulator with XRE-family HTH domain
MTRLRYCGQMASQRLLRAMTRPPNTVGWDPGAALVGQRLRHRRQELGLSQRSISCDGVSYAYISRLEAGLRQPSVKALRKLAPKLGVSVYWLEFGREDPARELAQLVLEADGGALPPRSFEMARAILA